MLEVTAEFAINPNNSVSAIGGAGFKAGNGAAALEFELGTQYRNYLAGDFNGGFHIGAEALGIMTSAASTSGARVSIITVQVLPMLGGKYTFDSGFTLEGQFGAGYRFVTGAVSNGSTAVAGAATGPTVTANINMGWAF